jgi:hypothetical protein
MLVLCIPLSLTEVAWKGKVLQTVRSTGVTLRGPSNPTGHLYAHGARMPRHTAAPPSIFVAMKEEPMSPAPPSPPPGLAGLWVPSVGESRFIHTVLPLYHLGTLKDVHI